MTNFFTEDESVFLVISESGVMLSSLVCDFLRSKSLKVEFISLNQDFFLNYEKLVKQQKNIYKIILIYGFQSVSHEVFQKIADFLNLQNQDSETKTPLILVSSVTTSLEILDEFDFGYQEFLAKQTAFLDSFINAFAKSTIFLGQDVLLKSKIIDYPLLLFFSAIKKNYIFDLQNNFYFQDEKSFFNLIKEYLIKPHQSNRFIVRGAKSPSGKLGQKIKYLCEQYFQKTLLSIKVFTSEKKQALLQDFSLVNNTKCQIEDLLDQKIRGLIDSDQDKDLSSISEEELKKALEMSRLQKNLQIKKIKAQNRPRKNITYPNLELTNQARKESTNDPPTKDFRSEFTGKIEAIFSTQRHKEKKLRQEKNVVQGKIIVQKTKTRKILFWTGAAVFSLSLITLGLFVIFNLSQKTLKNNLYFVIKSDLKETKKIDESVNYHIFSAQLEQYKKLFSNESLSEAIDVKNLAEIIVNLDANTEGFERIAYDLYKKTFEGGVKLNQTYEELLAALDKKIETQKQFNAYLMNLNLDLYEGEERSVWQNSLEKVKVDLKNNLQLRRFLSVFKDFALQDGRINMLVLMQDSSELRATGGFLTEAVVLGFNEAVLVDQQVFNISDLDKRVYGRKESPSDIKELLGEEILFLHDSNWQADFSKSSEEIQWFIEQATSSKVDLVIALNSKTLQEIVAVLGELQLGENLSINADNYLSKQEEFATSDYKNPTDQKFTWQLTDALLEKLFKLSDAQFSALSEVLITQLNQKELLLQSNNQILQQAIESNAWSGEESELLCPGEFQQTNCLLDFIFQTETNVGTNKVNPYIKETIEHSLGISEKFIRHKRKIVFENTASSDLWPLGSYRNYLRFYLNGQANLEKIELNNQKVDLKKVKVTGDEAGKEISMLIEIPKQSRVDLTITYLVPNSASTPFSYVFLDQKQAGVFNKKTNYKVVFDEQFKPQLIAPQATYQDKVVYFKNENLDHFLFAISFDQ